MISSIYEVRQCPECSGSNLSYIEGRDQVVCRDCGLVYEPLTPAEEQRLERANNFKGPSGPSAKSKKQKAPAKKSKPKKAAAHKKATPKKKHAAKKGNPKKR